ncbi:ribosome small subunit-dependent GTPase A [Shewanella gelidii]|uniref:Small ribosomal subunit biogenesis GTPase RsgA n=1 Tax=Shewanella gelidii TaxID=1642821 RepID=A0A917NCP8_9GAMM|nr:ribosome small subunit-dependent GTPase A [Shewanella gelidii]MCL1097922.1 ribosome small subunit-dependent GTPase A [Shewanella gelidii]GGI84691.1 putative ribosome biogenesis GTPase RsgA [Shewanella gelidii]
MNHLTPTLQQLGWKPFFQQQVNLEELSNLSIGRVVEQHRDRIVVVSPKGQSSLRPMPFDQSVCVGDWVLFDDTLRICRSLERQSIFKRKAPGTKVSEQLIAANIDTVMIVCSLNHDFSLNRIERYLAIAREAMVEPVIILTKADLCEDADIKRLQVQELDPTLVVYTINTLDNNDIKQLESYCFDGNTLAFLGSSGVGKSTLVNALVGYEFHQTGGVREEDSKGRHTTTHRALKVLPQGGILMDTPGMRELQLSRCEQGVNQTFSEITELADKCRFSDCTHRSEPGCAIQQAIKGGLLSERRLLNYQKLKREQALNGASLAGKRAKDKALGKLINSTQNASRRYKKGH